MNSREQRTSCRIAEDKGADALWPANDEEAARQKERSEDRAGHALAAFYLLMPLAAAVAIVVIALLRD